MTFEKQQCEQCKKVSFCVLHYKPGMEGFWYCEKCYSWVIEDADHKDKVLEIMINCGIEDLEKC